MSENLYPKRRDFLKTAAAGAAGAMGLSALKFDKLFAQSTGAVWVKDMQINPAIDNRRVICCHDTNMLTSTPANTTWANQNASVNATVVSSNMDEMAMELAQKTTAADAWSTIFRTGNAGGWGSTRVAIKTNGIIGTTGNHPRVAIIKKICDVLVDQLGVKPANIILYDVCDDASGLYSSYSSLTDSTKIRAVMSTRSGATLGGWQSNVFKAVTLTKATNISAPADLVDGTIDILVNIAVCKMHNGTGGKYSYGTCTLCMKNHFGTFTSGTQAAHSNDLHSSTGAAGPPAAMFEINQHSVVLGGTPVRQQLCIVDALLTSAAGPGSPWDNRTDRIVMGTLAPIVDYLTANKILLDTTVITKSPIPQDGVSAAATILPQFLTSFGYTATDPQWVECTPPNWPPITGGTGGTSGSGGAGSGGTSGSGGAGSGGTKGSGGAGSGGTTGGAGSGGTNAAGGARSGGTSAAGGAGSGGTTGGAGSGGTSAAGGARSGGTSAAGGAASGGTSAAGGAGSGGTSSGAGGAGGTGGAATNSVSASGGSASTGGTSAGTRTGAAGGSSGSAGSTAKGGNSEGGCDIAGVDRRATRWGAMLAFGAVVAEKLRRLVSGGDRSS